MLTTAIGSLPCKINRNTQILSGLESAWHFYFVGLKNPLVWQVFPFLFCKGGWVLWGWKCVKGECQVYNGKQ